jgi:hypothetical protein
MVYPRAFTRGSLLWRWCQSAKVLNAFSRRHGYDPWRLQAPSKPEETFVVKYKQQFATTIDPNNPLQKAAG